MLEGELLFTLKPQFLSRFGENFLTELLDFPLAHMSGIMSQSIGDMNQNGLTTFQWYLLVLHFITRYVNVCHEEFTVDCSAHVTYLFHLYHSVLELSIYDCDAW